MEPVVRVLRERYRALRELDHHLDASGLPWFDRRTLLEGFELQTRDRIVETLDPSRAHRFRALMVPASVRPAGE